MDSVFNSNNMDKKIYTSTDIGIIITLSIFFLLVLYVQAAAKKYSGSELRSVEISVENNEVGISKEKSINIKTNPEDANISDLKWNVSNPNIISIEGNKIIGKELGKTTIFLENDKIKSNSLEISCVTYISEAKILNPIDKLSAFKEYKLDVEVFPKEAINKDYEIVSSNPEIVEVKDKNILYGKNTGKAVIYVKDTFGKVLAEMEIEVLWIKIKSIDLDEKELKLGVGQKTILYAKLQPLNATNTGINWESENPDIASVDDKGIITAKKPGIAKIRAKVNNEDKLSECYVSVTENKQLGTFLYSSGIYDIKSQPLFQSKTENSTKYWEQIEFLSPLDKEGFVKVRNSEGNPGFLEYKKNRFLKEKPKLIENIKYISNKDINMKNGSLIASTEMLLESKGYIVSAYNLLYALPKGDNIKKDDKGNYFTNNNPEEVFIGNPEDSKDEGSYIGFTKPVINMINYNLGDIVKDISGLNNEELLSYVDKQIPVLVWMDLEGEKFKENHNVRFPKGNFTYYDNIVCGIVCGYDNDNIYIHNPEKNEYTKHNKDVFFENFNKIKRPAIVLK